jgi:T-complex protein 1 subunit beta
LIKFSGVKAGEACTVVLRGATQQILDEAERSLHDALCVLSQTVKETKTVLGGGCSEVLMAKAVEEAAATVSGKAAIAMESFARALRQVCSLHSILANDCCHSCPPFWLIMLAMIALTWLHSCALHITKANRTWAWVGLFDDLIELTDTCVDMFNNKIADMRVLGITEAFKLKRQVLLSASEAAEMILRVDDIIR